MNGKTFKSYDCKYRSASSANALLFLPSKYTVLGLYRSLFDRLQAPDTADSGVGRIGDPFGRALRSAGPIALDVKPSQGT
jgi:hypothetical protein